jgi:rhodanese-related sulfurtransferase
LIAPVVLVKLPGVLMTIATTASTPRRGIDDVLAAARERLQRLSPEQAYEAIGEGAVLIDIRPAAQRAREGEIPGALLVERNVLEWHLDPASDARLPVATGYHLPLIVICSEGHTSSLAAASLQTLVCFEPPTSSAAFTPGAQLAFRCLRWGGRADARHRRDAGIAVGRDQRRGLKNSGSSDVQVAKPST